MKLARPVLFLALTALLATGAQASVPSASAPVALDHAPSLSSASVSAALDVTALEPLDEGPRFELGEASLLVEPRAESFHLDGVALLSEEPRRAPALRYPETRVRGFDFLGQEVIGVYEGVTLELRWGCERFGLGISEGNGVNLYAFVGHRPHEKTDPLGLAVPRRPGAFAPVYDAAEQGEAAKEDARYLGWLVTSPQLIATDYQYRREFLSTAGSFLGHAAGWVFNRPDWDLVGFGTAGMLRVPSALTRIPKMVEGGEELIRTATTIEKGAVELEAAPRLLTAAPERRLLPAASPGRVSQITGQAFHDAAYEALRLPENKVLVTGMTPKGPVNVVPDLLDKARTGVAEFKDWKKIPFTEQIQGEYAVARQQKTTFSLVISPKTESVAQRVQGTVRQTGGVIVEFDPATGRFSPVTFDPKRPTRIVR